MKPLFALCLSLSFAAPAAVYAADATPSAAPSASPETHARAKPTATASDQERALRQARRYVEDLKDEATYRISRARKEFERGEMDDDVKPEISRALDRAVDHVQIQVGRVEKTLQEVKHGDPDELKLLQEELDATQSEASKASDEIEAVRTRGGSTEATLQSISGEIGKIADRAESLSDKVDDLRDQLAEKSSEPSDEGDEGDESGRVYVGVDRHGNLHPGDRDKVHVGGSVEVKAGEKVKDAVAIGGDLTVEGECQGDAVAIGGNVHVTDTGRVRHDATAIGGQVEVDEGGKVDGQKDSVGPHMIISNIFHGHHAETAVHRPLPLRIGGAILKGAVEFILFFLLGLLVVSLLPARTEAVASMMEHHFWKSSGLGLLLLLALPFIAILLCLTLIGIPIAALLLMAMPAVGFFGYVALALLVGRRIPYKVEPTRTALLAVGAAVVVAVGMIPILGKLVWLLAAFPAIGAVVISRFGQEGQPLQPVS